MSSESRLRPVNDPFPIPTEAARPLGRLLEFPSPATGEAQTLSRWKRLIEFAALFVAFPLALFFHLLGHPSPLTVLWITSAVALVALLRDPTFNRRQLWNPRPLAQQLPQVLALFGAGMLVITAMVRQYAPQLFLLMFRQHPHVWMLVMTSYPVVSVYPQSLIYRAFIFHRYERLLQPDPESRAWLLILVSGAAFCLVHIIFRNWIALALTLPGGVLFAARYWETRSLCVSWLEHSLYGCFLFTIGLGQYFIVQSI